MPRAEEREGLSIAEMYREAEDTLRAMKQREAGYKNTMRMRLKWGRQQRQRAEHAEKLAERYREALERIADDIDTGNLDSLNRVLRDLRAALGDGG